MLNSKHVEDFVANAERNDIQAVYQALSDRVISVDSIDSAGYTALQCASKHQKAHDRLQNALEGVGRDRNPGNLEEKQTARRFTGAKAEQKSESPVSSLSLKVRG